MQSNPVPETEKYRTAQARIWACIVDIIVLLPFVLAFLWIHKFAFNTSTIIIIQTLSTFIPWFYTIILEYKYGQTVGKWVAGVKVLKEDETKTISLSQSIIRGVLYLPIQIVAFIYALVLFSKTNQVSDFNDTLDHFGGNVYALLLIIDTIVMISHKQRKSLHDLIAKTIVVRIQ